MDNLFGTTAVINEASYTVKRRSFTKITLMFLLVYLVGSFIVSSIMTIPMYVRIFSDEELMSELESNIEDNEAFNAVLEKALIDSASDMSAIMLICNIGLIAAAIFYCTKFERRRLFTLGFIKKGAVTEYLAGLGIGLLMFGAAFGIIIASGDAEFTGISAELSIPMILLFFVGYLIQGMSEEVLLRGYYFVSAGTTGNIPLAVFASSAFFALLHLGNDGISVLAILNVFLFGLFAAIYFLRRGSIWGIAAIHSMWNFAQGNIFGCQVSGTANTSSVFETVYNGNTIINGGAFGPEGGLGVTVVLFIGIVVLLFMKNKDRTDAVYCQNEEFFSA